MISEKEKFFDPRKPFASKRPETHEEWQARMGGEVLAVVRSGLYLDFRFLDMALSALSPAPDERCRVLATDGQTLYYQPQRLLQLYQENPKYLNRLYLHTIFHCVFRHLWLKGRREPQLWSLACDIAVENVIDSLNRTSVKRPLTYVRQNAYRQITAEEKVVAAAAKLCYSDAHITDLLDGLTEEKTAKFLTMLSDLGHASPIEHASFTFGIEGVSRTLLAQITRHRIASFSVQSQRYVRLDDFRYVVPPEIEAIPEAKAAFLESMNEDAKRYLDLAHKLEEGHTARLMAEGMTEKAARAKAGKQANEDARFVLPNACETKMVVTMNARSLMNFFQLRCCNRAQWEIRELAEKMFTLVYPVAPHIFAKAGPACLCGPCPEGKMCCGKTAEVRAKYAAIKEGAAV